MWLRCSAALITAATVAIVSVTGRRAASVDVVANLQVRHALQRSQRHLSLSFVLPLRLISSLAVTCVAFSSSFTIECPKFELDISDFMMTWYIESSVNCHLRK